MKYTKKSIEDLMRFLKVQPDEDETLFGIFVDMVAGVACPNGKAYKECTKNKFDCNNHWVGWLKNNLSKEKDSK